MTLNRSIFIELERSISEKRISILLGARQVGKTTLLRQLEALAHARGLRTRFFNLETSADLEALAGPQSHIFRKLTEGNDVVFIDEFHYLENASRLFKEIYDSDRKVKVFASGSSSLEIHKHLKESLAGRFLKTMVFPMTLEELRQAPESGLERYLRWGGLPGRLHERSEEAQAALLENIVSTYLAKDIKGLIKEENIRAFNSLLYYLAHQQGDLVVTSNLAKETGISEPTVARHLEIMTQTYVGHAVMSYSKNMANELKKSKKYYLYDIGIRNSLLKDFRAPEERPDKGTIYETFIFLHLFWQLKPNMEIRFWRTKKGNEVDFVVLKNRVPVPIEVKSVLERRDIPDGMRVFLRNYPEAPFGIVFCRTAEGEAECEGRTVYFKPHEAVMTLDFLKSVA